VSAAPADPLADVFPGTADAPLPRWSPSYYPTSTDACAPRLLPDRSDRRWAPLPRKDTR
jgi:hypothetical protein